ncbi:hypothetical protein PAHAL_9G179600 [Panicum hallii]|jgi:hypothetical protein|uniref:Uncharacterized protein n=1 Tax=Panicum hallii TaxID=206008 RepID=A0A2S3IKJ8_9POAL|nr:hypothetical protein PAHAL_9G179600 [Panicum hallii]
MSRPRALEDLMMAVDAGRVDVPMVDSDKQLTAPRRSSYGGRGRMGAPAPALATSSDASFEFSAVVSYSSASPASMVFSDGQLRAHQFPAVRSPAGGSSEAASPARRSASAGGSAKAAGGLNGSKKRVSFATTDGAASKAGGGGQGNKKSGGLLGCMGSACGSSRSEVVEPARNANRKVVAV